MKLVIGVGIVGMAAGIWASFGAADSAPMMIEIDRVFAVFFTLQFIGSLLLWHRARPGSGDAMVAPTLVTISAALLLGALPRALWPELAIRHAGSVASIAVLLTVVVAHRRRLRRSTEGS